MIAFTLDEIIASLREAARNVERALDSERAAITQPRPPLLVISGDSTLRQTPFAFPADSFVAPRIVRIAHIKIDIPVWLEADALKPEIALRARRRRWFTGGREARLVIELSGRALETAQTTLDSHLLHSEGNRHEAR